MKLASVIAGSPADFVPCKHSRRVVAVSVDRYSKTTAATSHSNATVSSEFPSVQSTENAHVDFTFLDRTFALAADA